MARWDKIISRGNVDDRRSALPVFGGLGIGGVAILLVFNLPTGGNPEDILSQIPVTIDSTENTEQFTSTDEYEVFASAVLGSNNELWQKVFNDKNKKYIEPTLVLFRVSTSSSCGLATSQVGPHYCPLDNTIYLDETFFDELTERFGARGGDVAEAYVIAHEVGHHVQNLLGLIDSNTIETELQADCFAGLWANSIKDDDVFEQNEIIEAIDAAAAVGDDRIQEKVTGQVNPETWTHGSSQQRTSTFNSGYNGDTNNCGL